MINKIVSLFAAVAFTISMIPAPVATAETEDSLPASTVWHYDGYRVEQLDLGAGVDGPHSIGDHVVVAISTGDDAVRDMYILRNGGYILVHDIPASIISESIYKANDNRFVWMEQVDPDQYYFNLVELDPYTGAKNTIYSDLFFNGAESVEVRATGDDYYFTSSIDFNNRSGANDSEIYWYDSRERAAMVIDKFNDFTREEMIDTHEGVLLTKVTFEGGEEQLWLYEDDQTWAIPDSWTVSHENIEAAHFLGNGTVEFFRMYQRHVYTPDETGGSTELTGESLSWYRDTADALQVVSDNMVWLDPTDEINLSTAGEVVELGTLGPTGIYRLEAERLFYDVAGEGMLYDITTAEVKEMPIVATDAIDNHIVGLDGTDIMYYNDDYDRTLTLGFGGVPYLSDESHVYWMGSDGNVYEATLNPISLSGEEVVTAVKTADNSTVYLIDGNDRYTFESTKVFYAWFDDFAVIETVTQAKLSEYSDQGIALYPAGTKVKLEGDAKVYTVGYDGKLHWIISQAVAYIIYGDSWNHDIIEITQMDLVDYSLGFMIDEADDADMI